MNDDLTPESDETIYAEYMSAIDDILQIDREKGKTKSKNFFEVQKKFPKELVTSYYRVVKRSSPPPHSYNPWDLIGGCSKENMFSRILRDGTLEEKCTSLQMILNDSKESEYGIKREALSALLKITTSHAEEIQNPEMRKVMKEFINANTGYTSKGFVACLTVEFYNRGKPDEKRLSDLPALEQEIQRDIANSHQKVMEKNNPYLAVLLKELEQEGKPEIREIISKSRERYD